MPKFNRANGRFFARAGKDVAWDERHIFKYAGWVYDFREKIWWTHNYEKALEIRQFAVDAAKEHIDNTEAIHDEIIAQSAAEDHDEDFPCPEGLNYLPFQKAGIAYAIDGHDTLIADPPGLGKTIQAIGVHNVMNFNKVLIICTASLKINWQREWEKWDVHNKSVGIAESVIKTKTKDGIKKTWTEHIWPDTDVVIVNYDMLEAFDTQIKSVYWGLLVCDECHYLKSPDSIRTKCVFGGKLKTRKDKIGNVIKDSVSFTGISADTRLFLTGTPILSRPVELWVLLKNCDPDGLGRSYESFVTEFCAAVHDGFRLDVSGASNTEKLQRLLRSTFMVRREKTAVLSELPDKTREIITLPHDKLRKPLKKEKDRVASALSEFESMMGLENTDDEFWYITAVEQIASKLDISDAEPETWEAEWDAAIKRLTEPEQILFTQLAEAREEVALAKVPMAVEHIQKLVQSDEPVIVFAYHKSVIADIEKELKKKKIRVGVITGDVPVKKRQQIVDDFQAGKLDVILGNIIAMGVGITLTRASIVLFIEIDWVPAMIEQAEDRAWRIGQDNAVLIQYLIVDGSIEARMALRLIEKMEVISEVLDTLR